MGKVKFGCYKSWNLFFKPKLFEHKLPVFIQYGIQDTKIKKE